ncbi:MAG: hypothetical protein JO247_09900, partial [Chloroflexi bacterium]|nr:hypothetical protein [Chloroflexota bacterium]
DPNGKELGTSLSLGPFVVPPADLGQASGAAPQLRLGDGIDLLSHGVSASGGQVTVNAIWAAEGSPSKDYTVFVHLLDGSGKVAAQVDTQPRGGDFPTSIWQVNDVVMDHYVLKAPAGQYTLELGMYDLATGRRLGPTVTEPVNLST